VEYSAVASIFHGRRIIQCFLRDVTDRERLEVGLVQSQKLAGLGQLSAGIAHELRNPLGIINASIHFIESKIAKNQLSAGDSVKKHLKIIKSEVDRSKKIIENLLNFSRVSNAEREMVDIRVLLEQTLTLVRKELLMNGVELVTNFAQIPPLPLNVDQMKQAFLNIILNASQAMPDGGTLTINTSTEGAEVKIEFQDTGVGIAPEHLNDIFNPFFTTKEPGVGTGLGLSLTHSIIERMQGRLQVSSEPGVGTLVTITIPKQ
jgi:signal transduction histidine kinase